MITLHELQKTAAGKMPENAHLFSGVGPMETPQSKPTASKMGVGEVDQKRKSRKSGVVCCVKIIACLRFELDPDNLIAGCKPIRDCVATSLGVDDRDKRVRWEYGQIIGTGEEGVIVKIEKL
jgi:hypothetical protein